MLAVRLYIAVLALALAVVILCTREIGVAEWVVVAVPFLFLFLDLGERRGRLRAIEAGLVALEKSLAR